MTVQDNERFKKMYTFAKDASSIAEGISLERLATDKAYQYSLLYPLGQIGEIAINMGSDVPVLYPNIEWSDWRGFRNRIFHDYGMIDFSIVLVRLRAHNTNKKQEDQIRPRSGHNYSEF